MGERQHPGAIGTLAELHDAHSVDELRQKVGEIQSAEEAIDAAMRQQTAPATREDPNTFDASILFGGNNDQGRAALNVPVDSGILNENVRRAMEMQRQGRSPSEIYNETGLSSLSNGRFRDMKTGEVFETGGSENEQRADAEDRRGGYLPGESGSSEENSERFLRPTRSWDELSEQSRTAAAEAVNRYADSSPNGEMSALRSLYELEGKDAATEIARRIYSDMRTDPIVAENNWGSIFSDINGLLNELSREGGAYEQQNDSGRSENWNAAFSAGGEGINREGRATALRMDAGHEGGAGSDRFQNLVREKVTPASLGVTNGSSTQTVEVVDNAQIPQGTAEYEILQRARERGQEIVYIRGTMQIGEGANARQARAYIIGNRVILQVNGSVSAAQLYDHEDYHRASRANPDLNNVIREALAGNMSEDELRSLVAQYIQAYDGVYDFSGMTQAEIEELCEEELFADLYAGIDNRGNQKYRDNVRQGFSEAQTMQQQNAEAERETRGPPKERASIAGINARTANSTTLQQAEQMERDGTDNEQIRQETGWYKGRDGQWRFEIDDSGAKYYRNGDARFRNDHPEYARYQDLMSRFLTGNLSADELVELQGLEQTWGREQQRLKGLVDSGHATLDMLLDHPALFEAYPQLREARIRFTDMEAGERGAYNSRTNSFTLSNELRSAPESTLIHEIQHAIQAYEGFSGGSSVEYWENQERSGRVEGWKSDRTKALEQEYTDLMESLPEETRQLIREANQAYADGDFERIDELEERLSESPYGSQYFDLMALEGRIGNARDADRKTSAQFNYMNTAGEIEARDSANRRNMTAEERKNTPPDLGDENTVFAEDEQRAQYAEAEMDYDSKSDTQQNWEKQIDRIKSTQEITGNEDNIEVRSDTPKVLLDHDKAARNLPIRIRYDAAYLATREGGDQPGHYHSLGDLMKQLPAKLENPILLLKLDNGRVNCLVEMQDRKGRNILVSVELNQWNTNTGDSYNLIVTTFGASKNYLNNLVEKKGAKVLYATEEASHFISGLNNTTENDLDTSSKEKILTHADEKSNPQNEGRASVEVPGVGDGQREPGYTVHDGVGKLFADQLDRLTEMADRQGVYYDGVQETLKDALMAAKSEEELDRLLAGKDSARFAYSPELTEKLWELRQLVDVSGERNGNAPARNENARLDNESARSDNESARNEVGGEQDEAALVNRYDRVQREYNQRTKAYTEAGERGDTAFDYKGEVRRISELQTELNELRDRLYGKAVTAEDAAGELLRTGKAQVSTEAGTYELTTRTLGDGRTAARIERDGKLLQAKAFDTVEEAAEYAASYANGNARGTVEAELYNERSEEIPQPEALDALFDPNGYTNEVNRQMKNKAARIMEDDDIAEFFIPVLPPSA